MVLAKNARVTTADDYRAAVRRGARFGTADAVVYVRRTDGALRFGFIVSKQVGGAVTRNTVRRRLKAVCYEVAPRVVGGADVVVRALPSAASASFADLKSELLGTLAKGRLIRADVVGESVAASHEGMAGS